MANKIRGIRQTIAAGYVLGRAGVAKGQPHAIRIIDMLKQSSGFASMVKAHDSTINGTEVQIDDTVPLTDLVLLQYILANDDWEYKSLSQVLDSVLGTTRGSVIYRNATVWTTLPPGTAGYVLSTNGANADPSWVGHSAPMPLQWDVDEPAEPLTLPGPAGAQGIQGPIGPTGPSGSGGGTSMPMPLDGDEPVEAMSIPGPAGAAGAQGATGPTYVSPPQGRLTLASGKPVLDSEVTVATTVFYTPYVGVVCPIFDGSVWTMTTFAEMSQTLADTTKSPAATTGGHQYDMFVWNDSGTIRCTRGPLWSSTTARGTGAGTTELVKQDGIWVNKNAITNGPGALKGTYVGTINTSGLNSLNMMFASPSAAGGNAARLDVWNMYNRVDTAAINIDSTATYTYSLLTAREKNGSSGNEINFICGIIEDEFIATNTQNASNSTAAGLGFCGVALNSTTVPSVISILGTMVAGKQASATAVLTQKPGLGNNFVSPMEEAQASGVTTWIGTSAPTFSHFTFKFRM